MKRTFGGIVLLLQGLLGPATALAHAQEQTSVPAAIEAQHGASCVVLHDAARCPGCGWTLQAPPLAPVRIAGQATRAWPGHLVGIQVLPRPLDALGAGSPRAPPVILL